MTGTAAPPPPLPPMPAGLRARPVAYGPEGVLASEVDLVLPVLQDLEVAALGRVETTRGEVAASLDEPQVARAHTYLVQDETDRAVALAWVEPDENGREVWLEVFCGAERPALRESMVDHAVAVGRSIVAGRADWTLRAGAMREESDYQKLLQDKGYQPVRHFWRMSIPSTSPDIPATLPDPPPGVTVESGAEAVDLQAHRRAVWEVDEAAFVDHWNHTPRAYEEYWEHVTSAPGATPDRWWLARVDGEPAAVCLLNDTRLDQDEEYVHVLGVLREHRRRGLARLLLTQAFVRAREAGRVATSLHVDAESPTGANRVYESVGMRTAQVFDAYAMPG